MKVTEQDLLERYESLETEQLIELQAQGGLTETATRVLEQVLAGRSVSPAERVAVASEAQQRVAEQAAMKAAIPSPGVRLGAKLIDVVVSQAISLLAFMFFPLAKQFGWLAIYLGFFGLFVSVVYLLLADGLPRGQSVGKRLLGIAVIDQVTRHPCTYTKSVVRNVTLWLLGPIDWLLILGRLRQRLGDKLCATLVVTVNRQGAPAEAG
ncbi:RDD family protein [Steroidobacter flavus]|uniref:RDD family protein n=1 Tax=Steroidobacter flavus TaxID=1842136 RepID=A0ABV8T5H4_9GAMM